MNKTGILLAAMLVGTAAVSEGSDLRPNAYEFGQASNKQSFQRIATLANYRNNSNRASETVSEIIAANERGTLLVYTDAVLNQVGFVDITKPSEPSPNGSLAVDGSPTSVDILGNRYALVAVDQTSSLTAPAGELIVVRLSDRTVVAEIALGGQPDSVKISPDGKYAAIAIENQRDETICVGGTSDGQKVSASTCTSGGGLLGGLPQTTFGNPAGYLSIVDLVGAPATWTRRDVALTGLADFAPEDPEPEFIDINQLNQAAVTLQENNHMVIVNLATGTVVNDFPMGSVNLTRIDTKEKPKLDIVLSDSKLGVAREPDAVSWVPVPGSGYLIATANEGDLVGGSRGFSLFDNAGTLRFDSGNSLEHLAVQHGHYPDDRSENKGTEPEAIEYGRFGNTPFLFVGTERAGFVAVYTVRNGQPVFQQILPAPLQPEGLLAIPSRNLVIASGEADSPEFGVRSTLMIYQLRSRKPAYPQIISADTLGIGTPIPWGALSGMAMLPGRETAMLAVWDSFYGTSRVLRINAGQKPAVIEDSLAIVGGTGNFDPEGIAIAPDRSIWVASEGLGVLSTAGSYRPNLLIQVDEFGNVVREVGLPAEVIACRDAATARGTLGSGFEGVAAQPLPDGEYQLVVAQQRGWDYDAGSCDALDDDEGGLNNLNEPNRTRLWTYNPTTEVWDHIDWELAPKPVDSSWVGLSEITRVADGFVLIERDNRGGDFAGLKTLVKVSDADLQDGLVTEAEKEKFDLEPALKAGKGWITDKPEGVAIGRKGRTFVVTDNDGVKDWSGETWFLELGQLRRIFP